jgi:hypothetical protein
MMNECSCDDGSCAACAPAPARAKPGYYGNGWPIVPSTDALERDAYELLARAAESDISDADLGRLNAISTELDRRGVPYQGRW